MLFFNEIYPVKNIYCISGLGADHRFFGNLRIDGYSFLPVPWVAFSSDDDMRSYALKMYHSIPEKDPLILGLSFGGMLTVEMCNSGVIQKGIIVSSAKTKTELGYSNPVLKMVYDLKILPAKLFTTPFNIVLYSLGANTNEEKTLLRDIISKSDPAFVTWCIKTLLSWENMEIPSGISHIHGTADRTISPKYITTDYWVDGGSHIMVYNRGEEISRIIEGILGSNI